MKLPLLESTSDVPSRIPIRRGVPSEASFAINTNILPNQLALPRLPADYGTEPMVALARLGAVSGQVVSQTGGLLMEAEVRRRDADETTQAKTLANYAAQRLDSEIEHAKATTTHETLKPEYYKSWARISDEVMAQAKTPGVQKRLGLQLEGLRTVTQREINTAWRGKYEGYHKGAFNENVRAGVKLASGAATDIEYAHQLRQLDQTFTEASNLGFMPADQIVDARAKALGTIQHNRAYTQAFLDPLAAIKKVTSGELQLDPDQQLSFMQYAENRIRTLGNDADQAETKRLRQAKVEQDELAMTYRTRISENFKSGGDGKDLLPDINGSARELGESNHASVQEMHRVYQDRFLNPQKGKVDSDRQTVGTFQNAIITGKFEQVSQRDLLRAFENNLLVENDYTRLSNLLDQKLQQAEAKREKKTDAEKARETQLKKEEKTIEEYIQRANKYERGPEATATGILAQDAVNELYLRAEKEPQTPVEEIADDMIVKRIKRAEAVSKQTLKMLPYKTKQEVDAANASGLIDKRSATRYYRIFKEFEPSGSSEKRGQETTPAPPAPGLLQQWLPQWFGGTPADPNAIRPPVKR